MRMVVDNQKIKPPIIAEVGHNNLTIDKIKDIIFEITEKYNLGYTDVNFRRKDHKIQIVEFIVTFKVDSQGS